MVNNLLSGNGAGGFVGILLAILILLVMITIHEFGHYIVGKLLHFRINEFAIGFGPALFKRKNKKTGEIFSLRLIPLGGYCAFAGEVETEEAEEQPLPEEKQPFSEFSEQEREGSELKKELPSFSPDTKKEEVLPKGKNFNEQKPWRRILVLLAGAFMNYLLALVLIIAEFGAYGEPVYGVWHMSPTEDEAYVGYSLQEKDVFLAIEGRNIDMTTDVAAALKGKKQGDLVSCYLSRVTGADEQGNPVRERVTVSVMLRSDVGKVTTSDMSGVWNALGILHLTEEEANALNKAEEEKEESERASYVAGYQLARFSLKFDPMETVGRSFVYSGKIAGSIFQVFGELFRGDLGMDSFGGPVSTIVMTSQIVSYGFRYFLEIAAYIGVNLAVFNLLPIPALDGSKIVFTLIEWVRGKPVNRKVEAIIHTVGMLLLFGFAILVDILRFI